MSAARQDAQVSYSTHTFRCLLDAIARPGKLCQLPYPDFLVAPTSAVYINMYAPGALLSLLDRETSFSAAAQGQWLPAHDPLVQWIALRSGSNYTPPEQTLFALLCDASCGNLLTQLNMGTLLEPEASSTAFYCVEQLAPSPEGLTLELQGPGIETTRTIDGQGLNRVHIEALNATRHNYPLGIDVYLIDQEGRCLGLPRTTHINAIV